MLLTNIEFYRKCGISPLRQDIGDLKRHFERRASLYRHLGILPSFIQGKQVLEVGPGSGFNSLYTASLNPSRYVLVEGNPTGVEDMNRLFSQFPSLRERIDIVPVLFNHYESADPFDFVFCEAMLTGLPDQERILESLASLVAPGGVLVVTSEDDISTFPESLRHLFAQLLLVPNTPLEEQVNQLMPIFSRHLSRLVGMSKPHEDWIIDNLLNPAIIGELPSIPKVISILMADFVIYGASPRFMTDWRWYKILAAGHQRFNQWALDQYWQNVHNLIDHSRVFSPRPAAQNRELYALCSQVRRHIRAFEESRDAYVVREVAPLLGRVIRNVETFSVEVADALREAQELLVHDPIVTNVLAESTRFGGLFGRSLQYLSFSKKD